MSAMQPVTDIPVPNYAAEEAAKPHETDRPVAAADVATAAKSIETRENGIGYSPAEDATDISNAARALAEARRSEDAAEREADPLDAESLRYNRGIRDLIRTFENYDNSAAVAGYNIYLNMFVRYGAGAATTGEESMLNNLRARENAVYDALRIAGRDATNRETRDAFAQAIDRWFAGTGVYFPEMSSYSSSDGFRFTPLSDAAKASTRARDVLASYERDRIAQYLREMAQLTPNDFMFYDPTGLGELALQQRRDFLTRMDEMLVEASIRERAAELRYVFNEDGQIQLDQLGIEEEELVTQLDRFREEINTYYGQLRMMTYQYKSGIVSSALG